MTLLLLSWKVDSFFVSIFFSDDYLCDDVMS